PAWPSTLSLHDALPTSRRHPPLLEQGLEVVTHLATDLSGGLNGRRGPRIAGHVVGQAQDGIAPGAKARVVFGRSAQHLGDHQQRSEEHTSELQSRETLV